MCIHVVILTRVFYVVAIYFGPEFVVFVCHYLVCCGHVFALVNESYAVSMTLHIYCSHVFALQLLYAVVMSLPGASRYSVICWY